MHETRFRTIWLSDIHLGTRGCKAEALVEFLDTHACEFLYLVGDIIDFWRLKRAPYWPQMHSDVIRKVLSKARAGTIVTFVPGNHDEYLRRFCDFQLGNIFITREAVHRTAAGRLLLILHGDEFDAVTRCHRWVALLGDVGYEHLLVLNRWFNRARRALGFGYFSLSAYVKWKVKQAMIFACDFEEAVAREAARRGMDGVVCGHIHKTEMRQIGPVLYCNTGDWVESCTALVEHEDGRLALLSYADRVNQQPAPSGPGRGVITAEPRPSRRRHFSVVAETYPPEVNGVALTLGHLVSGLRAQGHVVSVIRPRQRRSGAVHSLHDATGTLVRGLPLPRYEGLQIGLPAGGALRECWTRLRPDAVYVATEGPLGYSAVRTARRLGLPVFSGFHTNFHGYVKHYRAGWLRHLLLRYLRHFHNGTDGTIVPTVDLRDRLDALGFARLSVLGRGVDTRLFSPERRCMTLREAWGASAHDLVVLHVGRLAPEKNPALAVEAYRAMQRARRSLRCVIVGDGPRRAALQRANPDLIFTGVLAGEELAAHYASADVFVFPSETETFGNVTLEALASGLAVIAYDYAAARLHITHEESGLLVPVGDARRFVAEAVTLARSPDLLSTMRRQARDSVAAADWARVVEEFEAILTGTPVHEHDEAFVSAEKGEIVMDQLAADPRLLLVAALSLVVLVLVGRRIASALSTIRARALAPAAARRLAGWVKPRSYSDADFFRADGAGEPWIERRREGIERLSTLLREHGPRSRAWGDSIREGFSDLRFADANRVPFPFARFMRERFNLCAVATASDGPRLQDLDGHWTLDVSGSYGVNVAGFARYKEWMARGLERVKDLGPVLGPLHPVVAENIAMLRSISKLEEVSFHMSGTEAVMAAVRLARFNTRRKLIVCFSGAYHGWWDGVQPGLGSERSLDDCLTLKDLNPASLDVIRRRAREIAGVLVNPVQSFHPNAPPPNDAVLLTSGVRKTEEASARYARWLQELRAVCAECDVPLIFDEVYTGFRLAPGGAQEYFGVQADLVVYGKTVAGGMPIGVVCGTRALMRRFDPERPMRLAYVIGTFSAHPVVMGAMNEFLRWLAEPSTARLYEEMNERCAQWARETNRALADAALPLRVVHLATVWTVLFTEPGRYNWLLQYYLRAEGLTLSWVGTGRCLASMDFTDKDYEELRTKLLSAAHTMKADGWWLSAGEHPGREKHMRVRLVREVLGSLIRVPRPLQSFYAEIMRRKHDDHHASHSDAVNQLLHLISSSVFLGCYALAFWDLTTAMWAGLAALFLRQIGHAILEPPCHDKEALLLGFNTPKKTLILGVYLLLPVFHVVRAGALSVEALASIAPVIAWQWFLWTLAVVGGRVVYLMWIHDFRIAMIWFVKLITDPITDIAAYSPRYLRRP